MKKFVSFFLSFVFLVASGCFRMNREFKPSPHDELNRLTGVVVKVEEESVVPTGLVLELINDTEYEFTFGEAYTLEEKIDDKWYLVPIQTDENYGFTDIGYHLEAHETVKRLLDWEWLYGTLEPGDYRLLMDILDVHESGDVDTYLMSAEFTI